MEATRGRAGKQSRRGDARDGNDEDGAVVPGRTPRAVELSRQAGGAGAAGPAPAQRTAPPCSGPLWVPAPTAAATPG